MNTKMLILDMDDTLLKEDLTISKRNIEAIEKAEYNGVTVVLASGRSPFAMEKYIAQLGLNKRKGYTVCYNGAIIKRSDTDEEVYSRRLNMDLAIEIAEFVKSLGLPIQTYDNDTIYVTYSNEYTDLDCKLSSMLSKVIINMDMFLKNELKKEPIKFVIPEHPDKIIEIEKIIKSRFGHITNIFTSKPYFLEVLNKDADKGIALTRLSEISEIPLNQMIAMGDAMNDAGMLKVAGTGIAVANSIEHIKSISDIVIDKTNEQDAVAYVIEKYIL